jgi:hypothetical protein
MTDQVYEDTSQKIESTVKPENKRRKHNYTSELELKSLLIRIKNDRSGIGTSEYNSRINKYIKWHTRINAEKYEDAAKKTRLKAKLKSAIIDLSEKTSVDQTTYERFGQVILLMVKNILTKPQFSGYTYKDDFYSDAVYKILKYLHNFDHKLISQRTNQPVNSFAYISQIIHNSIIFIINTKKKDNDNLKHQVAMANLDHNLQVRNYELVKHDNDENKQEIDVKIVNLNTIDGNLIEEIKRVQEYMNKYDRIEIQYPADYAITIDEYNDMKGLLGGKISIMRKNK